MPKGLGNCGSKGIGKVGDCGCGCSGHPDSEYGSGLGNFGETFDSAVNSLTGTTFGFPTWMLAGGAIVILLLLSSRGNASSDYSAAKARAKARYASDLADANRKYGRRYRRYGEAVAGPIYSGLGYE
jgi:hypothetical protein